jgi:hypothetical protein
MPRTPRATSFKRSHEQISQLFVYDANDTPTYFDVLKQEKKTTRLDLEYFLNSRHVWQWNFRRHQFVTKCVPNNEIVMNMRYGGNTKKTWLITHSCVIVIPYITEMEDLMERKDIERILSVLSRFGEENRFRINLDGCTSCPLVDARSWDKRAFVPCFPRLSYLCNTDHEYSDSDQEEEQL